MRVLACVSVGPGPHLLSETSEVIAAALLTILPFRDSLRRNHYDACGKNGESDVNEGEMSCCDHVTRFRRLLGCREKRSRCPRVN
eukprot:37580-Rhodomonas_salina.1